MVTSFGKKGDKVQATKLKTQLKVARAAHELHHACIKESESLEKHSLNINIIQKAGHPLVQDTQLALVVCAATDSLKKGAAEQACEMMDLTDVCVQVEDSQLFDDLFSEVQGTEPCEKKFDGLNPKLSLVEGIMDQIALAEEAFEQVFVSSNHIQTLVECGEATAPDLLDIAKWFTTTFSDAKIGGLPITLRVTISEICLCLRALGGLLTKEPFAFGCTPQDVEKVFENPGSGAGPLTTFNAMLIDNAYYKQLLNGYHGATFDEAAVGEKYNDTVENMASLNGEFEKQTVCVEVGFQIHGTVQRSFRNGCLAILEQKMSLALQAQVRSLLPESTANSEPTEFHSLPLVEAVLDDKMLAKLETVQGHVGRACSDFTVKQQAVLEPFKKIIYRLSAAAGGKKALFQLKTALTEFASNNLSPAEPKAEDADGEIKEAGDSADMPAANVKTSTFKPELLTTAGANIAASFKPVRSSVDRVNGVDIETACPESWELLKVVFEAMQAHFLVSIGSVPADLLNDMKKLSKVSNDKFVDGGYKSWAMCFEKTAELKTLMGTHVASGGDLAARAKADVAGAAENEMKRVLEAVSQIVVKDERLKAMSDTVVAEAKHICTQLENLAKQTASEVLVTALKKSQPIRDEAGWLGIQYGPGSSISFSKLLIS